ncbi:MAG: class I SAM-dependent methyltransferase [Calditrichaeota bacterium]|nr:MAG: class I SAM-dependent methyltransferase [Calditrichota bacterium]MBL1207246.1 class I SAM-dependent methyltransferase [Calditrichota bacterium]NOG47079.1 class I SAM-dependent methyltransferase [Calditrichota bacterium]
MNSGIENTQHPSIIYYDSDYPSEKYSKYKNNFDEIVISQGLSNDVEKYNNLAKQFGSNVLELCCGTGRVAIPLAENGNDVTAVDFSSTLLQQFQNKIKQLNNKISNRLKIINQDVTKLSLEKKDYDLIICAFNSLLCIPDFELQQKTLINAAKHIRTKGLLALDLMNPLVLSIAGDETPIPFFTRKNPHNGNIYTRFAARSKMMIDQKQKLYGWYDEIEDDGSVKRQNYEVYWRPVFRYEIQLMLEKAGFKIDKIYGGHLDETYTETSGKLFIQAVKL